MSKLYHTFIVIVFMLNTLKPSTSIPFISDVLEVYDITKAVLDITQLFGESPEDKLLENMNVLQNKMDQINSKIKKMQTEVENISAFIESLPEQLKQALRLDDLRKYMVRLNELYEDYENYSANITKFEKLTLENFANTAISCESNAITDLVSQIHALMLPPDNGLGDKGILQSAADALQRDSYAEQCQRNQSQRQILSNVYNYIALAEVKGYITMQFSYMLLHLFKKGNFTTETQLLREKYEANFKDEIKLLKNVVQPLTGDIWKCDPTVHIEGRTYVRVTELVMGYIETEVDLNSQGTCTDTCGTLRRNTSRFGCYDRNLCLQQDECDGDVINCSSFPGAPDYERHLGICQDGSGSRPGYVVVTSGRMGDVIKIMGSTTTTCNSGYKVINIGDWDRGFVKCEYCFCFCDQQGEFSDRYFNMRPVMADIKNNRVVTGLRFVKNNRIIHLQIQEGKLLPRGSIDLATVRWVPVEDYGLTNGVSGVDYHTLTYDDRAIDFGDVLANKGHVLTGIRLTKSEHLELSITTNAFDFLTGLLVSPEVSPDWTTSSVTDREELYTKKPDIPIKPSSSPHLPDSKSNSYIRIGATNKYVDLSQNTVPYLDAQPVESLLSVPLGGAGMYHRGRRGSGGFIAPKIITYDFSQHL